MQRILLLRSLPLDRDARSTKMVADYRARGHSVTGLVWTRGEAVEVAEGVIACTVPGGYGRRLRGLAARLGWMRFMAARMWRSRGSYDVVHAVDLDTAIVAVPLARLFGKRIVYDAFDHIGAIAGPGWVGAILSWVERRAITAADIALFPDPIRLEQYGVAPGPTVRCIGNIPDVREEEAPPPREVSPDAPLRIVYIGTLEADHRGLEYIPDICAALVGHVEFVVGGTGALRDVFEAAAARHLNLRFIGHQAYPDALREMVAADCLYGPYLLSAPAHRYASPNKMYEHLALGRPLLTSDGTPPAALVARLGSGLLFDGTPAGARECLRTLDRDMCRRLGSRARAAWTREFAGLRQRQVGAFFELFDTLAQRAAR